MYEALRSETNTYTNNMSCTLIMERVLVGGSRSVDKTKIIQDIADDREDCIVSRMNFKVLRERYKHLPDNSIWWFLRSNQSETMIYEHTRYCDLIQKYVDECMQCYRSSGKDLISALQDAYNEGKVNLCLDLNVDTEQNVVIIDTRHSSFKQYSDERMYFECVAYTSLAFACRSDPFFTVYTLYDDTDRDPALEKCGVYDILLHESEINPCRYILKDERLVKNRIIALHRRLITYTDL